jgi:hypothetical protein
MTPKKKEKFNPYATLEIGYLHKFQIKYGNLRASKSKRLIIWIFSMLTKVNFLNFFLTIWKK